MQRTIHISTPSNNGLYDITRQVEAIVAESADRPVRSASMSRASRQE